MERSNDLNDFNTLNDFKNSKIYIAGHTGLVGSALLGKLEAQGCADVITRTHSELDLERQADVEVIVCFLSHRHRLTLDRTDSTARCNPRRAL